MKAGRAVGVALTTPFLRVIALQRWPTLPPLEAAKFGNWLDVYLTILAPPPPPVAGLLGELRAALLPAPLACLGRHRARRIAAARAVAVGPATSCSICVAAPCCRLDVQANTSRSAHCCCSRRCGHLAHQRPGSGRRHPEPHSSDQIHAGPLI